MAYYTGSDVGFVILDGYDLVSNLTDFSDDAEAVIEETTVLGNSWQANTPVGLNKYSMSANGFYDDADNLSVEALVGSSGSSGGNIDSTRILCYAPATNVLGKKFVGATINEVKVARVPSRGALHKINATFVGNGPAEDGIIISPLGAKTGSTGNSQATSYDGGSSSTRGGYGYYQQSTITLDTSTNFVVSLRHSSDNITFATLLTFTGSTVSRQFGERKATAATTTSVERYLAAAWSYSDTAANTSRTATFFAGFVRG